ncbi:hypothetical protein GLW08_00045 [Pontibacillus yanchengensis]|uniref:Uncharacterized protein n=2 Tax=Pontibacillus yanchengensis TaxID=462910 RepID=A0ACC7VC16_9BACI|nr:isoprenylcysteine carboxylmethyltransferase family protein [Pontibacillus yanchengensis]MYL32809.1 hypothetical protein [Pontibacillus yanchengensis]MYL51719.1 hypothetical protein [Pontibacillus yanchengensis]
MNLFYILFFFIIIQRIIEVMVAKRNEKWMKQQGGIEVGEDHYKWIVLVHILFFLSIALEAYNESFELTMWKGFLFGVFLVTQGFRIWCLTSLGRYWNTKIIVLPGANLIAKGPYRYFKHPNYLVVGVEFIVIPLLLNAYFTAVLFPIFHVLLMKIRIPHEEKALTEAYKS